VQALMVLMAFGLAVAIFLTMPAGKAFASKIGLKLPSKSDASNEDHDYLLRVCGGNVDELQRRLKAARGGNFDMTEAQAYRSAIRAHLRDKI
jgi:hypothetical protein